MGVGVARFETDQTSLVIWPCQAGMVLSQFPSIIKIFV